jgi:hypothetical protein
MVFETNPAWSFSFDLNSEELFLVRAFTSTEESSGTALDVGVVRADHQVTKTSGRGFCGR